MEIQYFQDTDTLYIELNDNKIAETRDLDDFTLLEFDEDGGICGITLERASRRADIEHVTMEGLAA